MLKQAAIGMGLSLAFAGVGLDGSCWAAESSPLRITGSSGRSLLPNTNSNQMQVERLLKSMGLDKGASAPSDPIWALPPPPSSSTPLRNPKLQEMIERRKNWIFDTPEMQSQSLMESDPLSAKFGKSSTKTTVEQYWERENSKLPTTRRELDEFSSSIDSDSPSSASSLGASGFESYSLTPASLSQSGSLSNSINSILGSRLGSAGSLAPRTSFAIAPLFEPPTAGLAKDPLAERIKADDFERILRPSSMSASKAPNNDPINSALDTTRQSIQPIAPGGFEDLASTPGLPLSPDRPKSPTFMGSLDLPAARPGGSSLNPAFATGANSSWVQPKPAVLEFPKRRF